MQLQSGKSLTGDKDLDAIAKIIYFTDREIDKVSCAGGNEVCLRIPSGVNDDVKARVLLYYVDCGYFVDAYNEQGPVISWK